MIEFILVCLFVVLFLEALFVLGGNVRRLRRDYKRLNEDFTWLCMKCGKLHESIAEIEERLKETRRNGR